MRDGIEARVKERRGKKTPRKRKSLAQKQPSVDVSEKDWLVTNQCVLLEHKLQKQTNKQTNIPA